MKILSWNINGIRAIHKKNLFLPLLEKENPDILCLQETKISDIKDFPEELHKLGYEVYLSYSKLKKGYSGVAILSKIKPISVEEGMGIEKFDIEGRILKAEFDDFFLFSVYFPNGQQCQERLDYKMEFYTKFEELVNKLKKQKNVIVCGDVNTAHTEIDLARPKDNENYSGFLKIERDWISHFLNSGWIDTLRIFYPEEKGLYTWWSYRAIGARKRNVGWRIDYFYINKEMKNNLNSAFILPQYEGSDHCPIGIELK